MKILMLGWELPPYHSGGLGIACFELCKALSMQGVSIDFVVPYADKHEEVDFMNVIPALPYKFDTVQKAGGVYDSKRYGSMPKKDPHASYEDSPTDIRIIQSSYNESIRHIIKDKNYDAIHAHDWLTFEAGIKAKQLMNRPLVAHVHATEFDRAGKRFGNPIIHEIEYTALCMADKVIAVSQATKELIVQEYFIPEARIDVLHNSINQKELEPLEAHNSYSYHSQMKELGYSVVTNIGRQTIQKGLTHLLHAAKQVIAKNPNVLFLFAGSGDQYHELIELTASLGISQNVAFTGTFVQGKAWRDAYAVSDIFVLPSVSEPFGITPLEAIGYGTIPLISKQAGVGEVVWNALKFDYWDTTALANQILAVVEHTALRKTLLENAADELKNMSWHKVASKCVDIYHHTINKNKLQTV